MGKREGVNIDCYTWASHENESICTPKHRGLLCENATMLDFDRVTLRLPNVIDHGQAAQEAKQEDAQGRSCW